MRHFGLFVYLTFMVFFLSACSIRHDIHKDYPQYLAKHSGKANFSTTDLADAYYITPSTKKHKYEFRAVMTGYGHLWIVDFGQMLEDTLSSEEVQIAFDGLENVKSPDGGTGGTLVFHLLNYKFDDFCAQISIKVSLLRSGEVVFDKIYTKRGVSQGGKMFWGGAFAQRNAVQQSTKYAVDDILRELISDLNTKI